MTPHEFVLSPDHFYLLWEGIKTVFPVYDFQEKLNAGDRIILQEYGEAEKKPTGREIRAQIWHVFRNVKGAPAHYVVVQIIDPILYSGKDGET